MGKDIPDQVEPVVIHTAKVLCICGNFIDVNVSGNNNADGKNLCKCGRHITIHFRKHMIPK